MLLSTVGLVCKGWSGFQTETSVRYPPNSFQRLPGGGAIKSKLSGRYHTRDCIFHSRNQHDLQGGACGRGLNVVDNKVENSGVPTATGQQGIYSISPLGGSEIFIFSRPVARPSTIKFSALSSQSISAVACI